MSKTRPSDELVKKLSVGWDSWLAKALAQSFEADLESFPTTNEEGGRLRAFLDANPTMIDLLFLMYYLGAIQPMTPGSAFNKAVAETQKARKA